MHVNARMRATAIELGSAFNEVLRFGLGILFLTLLARLRIVLPFTPVPITGQTYGIAVIALTARRRQAFFIIFGYVFLGEAGLPVFSQGQAAWSLGPASGYLFGMVVASVVIATLAAKRNGDSFWNILALCTLSSYLIFSFGVLRLMCFYPLTKALVLGYLPFVPGDCIKITAAAFTVSRWRRLKQNQE